jgi:hypothetical protein
MVATRKLGTLPALGHDVSIGFTATTFHPHALNTIISLASFTSPRLSSVSSAALQSWTLSQILGRFWAVVVNFPEVYNFLAA